MKWASGAVVVLIPQSEDKFFDRAMWGTVSFVKDENGQVVQLRCNYNGTDYFAKRTRQ